MKARVGIARALLYYNLYPLWGAFLEKMGTEVIVSSPTNRQIFSAGVKHALDELCLPMKIFYGHILSLKDKVDYLFVPRIASIERGSFVCAKFWGLSDVIKNSLEDIPPLLTTNIDLNRKSLKKSMWYLGGKLTRSPFRIHSAYRKAKEAQRNFLQSTQKISCPAEFVALLEKKKTKANFTPLENPSLTGFINHHKVGLIGRSYNIYDEYLNMDIVSKLEKMGVSVIVPEVLPPAILHKEAKKLSRQNYWSYGNEMLGAAHYLAKGKVDGLIFLASFGCGPDSLLVELAIRKLEDRIPILSLIFDEGRAETNILTRLESFIEIIKKSIER